MSTSSNVAASSETDRDVLTTVALAAAVVSALGYLTLLIGHLTDPADFNSGKHPSTANNVAFFAFVVGLLVALFLGGALWFYGRRTGRANSRSRAAVAVYCGAALLVVALVSAALGG